MYKKKLIEEDILIYDNEILIKDSFSKKKLVSITIRYTRCNRIF